MARKPTAPALAVGEFLDEGEEPENEAASSPEVTAAADDPEADPVAAPPAPEPPAAEPPAAPETPPVDAPSTPEAPPAEAAAPAEPPVQIPGYPPGVQPPPWKAFEQYKKDSEALAALNAQRHAEQEELTRLRAIHQVQEQNRLAALQQQQTPQGPWTPESNRVPTQQEFNAYHAEDPIGAQQWLGLYNAQQNEALRQQQQQIQYEMQIRDQGEQFRRQHPDYDQVLAFAQDFEMRTARGLGLSSERDLQAYLENRIQEATRIAHATGKTIHQAIYDYAVSVGYSPQQAAQAAAAAPDVAAPQGAAPSPVDKVRAAQARQAAAATSIGPVGGSVVPAGKISLARYRAMPEAEMDEMERIHGEGWEDRLVDFSS